MTETEGILSEDVPFLNFDEVLQRISKQFGYQFAGHNVTVNIDEIALVYGITCIKDDYDSAMYIPMWQVSYSLSTEPDNEPEQMYFSAIDGSTMEPRLSRAQLMKELGE